MTLEVPFNNGGSIWFYFYLKKQNYSQLRNKTLFLLLWQFCSI